MQTQAPSTLRTIGSYDLLQKIAEGGMGSVYKGRSHTTGEIVAIKIIPAETAKNPVLLKRFEQEFRAASLLDHPNIVKAIEYNGTCINPFLVMEYVEGQSLGKRVEKDGAFTEEFALRILAQVCDGLHRAHKQGLIHRDVKPDNILVTASGVAKLTDLGLVKDVEGELNLTKTGRGLGTPHFMAPEQFRNAKNVDVRCDIYSLGATMYMMLTGSVPFAKTSPLDCWMKKIKNDFPPPRKLKPELSERLNWAVLRSMSADPAMRPASCRELLEDLTGQAWQGWNHSHPGSQPSQPGLGDLWYLVYKNASGLNTKVKGTTDSIRQNVRMNMLGDQSAIMVCRSKAGPFVSLKNVPEFRDLVITAGTMDASRASGKHASPSAETARSIPTATQTNKPRRVDPAANVPTEIHDVKPQKTPSKTRDAGSRHASAAVNSNEYLAWLLIALVITAVSVGLILFTRGH